MASMKSRVKNRRGEICQQYTQIFVLVCAEIIDVTNLSRNCPRGGSPFFALIRQQCYVNFSFL